MNQYISPLLWLIGINTFFIVLFDKKFEVCLPISLISIINITILTGFIKKLSYGYYLSLLIILLGILLALYKVYKDKSYIENLKNNYLTIGFFIFILLYIYIMVLHNTTTFKYWDEFMHWGFMCKESFRINAFYSEPESLLRVHKDYPPFSTILEYLWCKVSANYYNEPFTFRAMSTLVLSFILPTLSNLNINVKKDWFKGLFFVFLFLMVQVIGISDFFPTFADSIYTDFLLGILCAYGIYLAFSSEEFDLFNIFSLSMISVALITLKQMGLPFYILILFMIIIRIKKPSIKQIIYFVILLIVLPLSFYVLWSKYITNLALDGQFNLSQIQISSLLAIMNKTSGKPYQIEAFHNYLNALVNRPVLSFPIKLNYIVSSLLVTLMITSLGYLNKVKEYYKYCITYLIGGVGYGFAMLLLYVYSFNDYEGPLLASYERYLGTYIYVGFLLFVFLLVRVYTDNKKKILNYLLVFLLIFSFVLPVNLKKLSPIKNEVSYLQKAAYLRLFTSMDKYKIENQNIMIISQYASEIGLVAQYSYPTNHFQVVSLGKQKYDGDITALDISIEEFKEELSKYDYIYIFNSDEPFYRDYWSLLSSVELINHQTYKISIIDNNIVFTMID